MINPTIGLAIGRLTSAHLHHADQHYDSLDAAQKAAAPTVNIGIFINTIINFLIISFAIFWMVKAMSRVVRKEAPPEPGPTQTEVLLTEIRDLLATQARSSVPLLSRSVFFLHKILRRGSSSPRRWSSATNVAWSGRTQPPVDLLIFSVTRKVAELAEYRHVVPGNPPLGDLSGFDAEDRPEIELRLATWRRKRADWSLLRALIPGPCSDEIPPAGKR